MPSSQFEKLPAATQERIVDASLAEFAANGYDAASTNRIVAEAGISKGVLFKYFEDKAGLFLYVADAALHSYFEGLPDGPQLNLTEWMRATTAYKLRFLREKPRAYQLFIRMMKDPAHPVYARAIATQTAELKEVGRTMTGWVADANLRPGVTLERLVSLLGWISAGLQDKILAILPDVVDENLEQAFDRVLEEFDVYFDMVRFGIYQEGERS